MKKLSVGLVLVAVLVVAGAVPAGAEAAHTLPLSTDCGDFNIIEGQGSLVGFEVSTGRPVVLHGVEGKFVIDVFVDGDFVDDVEEPEDFLKGNGRGLKLTNCLVDDEVLIFDETNDLDEDLAAEILAEFGIVVPEVGEVRVTGRFEGTLQVQFPGR
jgi:hypothetical protein